ncbi:hypothetical protein K435DRAFT_834379 [Dendrothele bispora CBS 962.96]|uniref:Uncharacterized protein n=1 Tax=Dendrothele bispora (strain CBS 962.96) TaxID=1314807 RepID=A0A4S8MST8_DENBC|nr:hypothetical protein K435DRAFT_834379 [Dendrothele bispora CBS 962.96]
MDADLSVPGNLRALLGAEDFPEHSEDSSMDLNGNLVGGEDVEMWDSMELSDSGDGTSQATEPDSDPVCTQTRALQHPSTSDTNQLGNSPASSSSASPGVTNASFSGLISDSAYVPFHLCNTHGSLSTPLHNSLSPGSLSQPPPNPSPTRPTPIPSNCSHRRNTDVTFSALLANSRPSVSRSQHPHNVSLPMQRPTCFTIREEVVQPYLVACRQPMGHMSESGPGPSTLLNRLGSKRARSDSDDAYENTVLHPHKSSKTSVQARRRSALGTLVELGPRPSSNRFSSHYRLFHALLKQWLDAVDAAIHVTQPGVIIPRPNSVRTVWSRLHLELSFRDPESVNWFVADVKV